MSGLPARCVKAVALGLFAQGAMAAVSLSLAVDDILGEGWRVAGISIALASQSVDRAGITMTVDAVELPDGQGRLAGVSLHCDVIRNNDGAWICNEGNLATTGSPIGVQDARWKGRFHPDQSWSLSIPKLALDRGSFGLQLTSSDGRWQAELALHRLGVTSLARLSNAAALPPGWGVKGRASGSVHLSGNGSALRRADADLVVDGVNYASPDGTQAAENGVVKAEMQAVAKGGHWNIKATARAPRGQLYSEPLFLDADQTPLLAKLDGSWQTAGDRLDLVSWSVDLKDTINLSGTGLVGINDAQVMDLTVAARSDDAGRLYTVLLQPFLIGTPADDMRVAGRVGMALHIDGDGLEQAGLDVSRLSLSDRQERFELRGLNGGVAWARQQTVPLSRLTAASASVYRIPTGEFAIKATFVGDRVSLVEPIVVPLLGGRITLDRFDLQGALIAGKAPRWEASASVADVSLEKLTSALEWPTFSGSVAGELNEMRFADRTFSIGGGLALRAFDGRLQVDNLVIQDPFGTVPVLRADAGFEGLSLEQLTQTFSFGRIEGRLNGDIDGLELVAWRPDRFKMHLFTPEGDRSRRRISQRAVENLTELGNGAAAGLSASFLRIFEEFRYDRIDLKVDLLGNVAELDGLARDDGGYYLVRGSGLPRIDVIGRNRSVAWQDLVERLKRIQVEGASIQ